MSLEQSAVKISCELLVSPLLLLLLEAGLQAVIYSTYLYNEQFYHSPAIFMGVCLNPVYLTEFQISFRMAVCSQIPAFTLKSVTLFPTQIPVSELSFILAYKRF